MAVYTHISETDLRSHLSRFDVGELLSFSGISEGVENTNYRLETTKGRFILTLFEKRIERDELPFYVTFMEYVRESGVPAPFAAQSREGGKIVDFNGKPSVITTFLEGVWSRNPTAAQCAALGAALGKMHLAGRKFPLKRKNSLSLPAWKNLILASGARANEVENGLAAYLEGELAHLERNWPKYLPKGSVHGDLFPDNVFFLGEEISGVIDFYFACYETLVYDLMLTVNAWCFDKQRGFSQDRAAALLRSYKAVRPLGRAEMKALPFFGAAGAVRIVATRLYDWLHPVEGALVRPLDPLEHVRILRFHRSVEGPGAYGISA